MNSRLFLKPMTDRTPFTIDSQPPWVEAAGNTPLAEVEFDIKPPTSLVSKVDETSATQLLYNQCYWIAFGRDTTPEDLRATGQLKPLISLLKGLQEKDHRNFILANMWGHRESGLRVKFSSKLLTGRGGENRFNLYRKAVINEWGYLDTSTMDRFFNSEKAATVLQDSETLAAKWIVGYKIGKPGDASEKMYDALECKLNPLWLTLEPTYALKLQKEQPKNLNADNKEMWELRMQVSKWQVAITSKATKGSVETWAKLRNESVKLAIRDVFSSFGQDPAAYYVNKKVWTSSLDFWHKLALSFRQVAVHSLYSGSHSTLDRWIKGGLTGL